MLAPRIDQCVVRHDVGLDHARTHRLEQRCGNVEVTSLAQFVDQPIVRYSAVLDPALANVVLLEKFVDQHNVHVRRQPRLQLAVCTVMC